MRPLKKYGILLTVLLAVGCTQKSPQEYIEEAEQAILKNDTEAAVIVLKNALSSEPRNLRARFLLGSVYFKRGNAESAEKELKIAFNGDYFKNEVLPLYLGSLDFLRRDDEIIQIAERVTGLNSETEAAVQTYKGLALFRKNEMSRGKLAIKRASDVSPESPYSRLGRAHHALQDGEATDALIILDELLGDSPEFMEAALMHGQLNMRQKNYDSAISSFGKYVEQKPGDAQGNFLLIDALVRAEKYNEAEAMLNSLLAKLPDHPKLSEFAGILAFNKNNYGDAKAAMEKAISNGANSPAVRLIAGVASYHEDKLEQAHKHLSAVQNVLPSSHPAKRLYAEIQLRLGYSTDAAQTLGNLGSYDLTDVKLFTQAGLDLVRQGDSATAQKMLDLAQKNEPTTVTELTRVGILKLTLQDAQGIQDLEQALAIDPKAMQARLVLTQAHISNNDFADAINVAKQWVEAAPEEITAYNLLAEVYELSGQMQSASDVHEQALQLSSNNPSSLAFKAKQAEKGGNSDQALLMLKQAAENNPEYLEGTFTYLIQAKKLGDEAAQQALDLMKQVHETDLDNVMKSLNYARGLIVQSKPQEALTIFNKIEPQVDMPLFFWKGQADSYLKLNRPNDALNVYTMWQELEPKRREAWLSGVLIQDGLRDMSGALDTIKRAKNFHQNDGQFQTMEVHYSLLSGNVSVAQRLLDGLPERVKSSNIVQGIQGQIYFAQREYSKAIPLMSKHYQESFDGRFALMIADAKTNVVDKESGIEVLREHVQNVPLDLNIRARLAERVMNEKPREAIEHYEFLLEYLPENIVTLNNLGWLYGELGETSKAVEYAEKAVALRPENPKLLDTLGVVLLKDGQVKRAQEVSAKAFNLEPSNQVYRINFENAKKTNP